MGKTYATETCCFFKKRDVTFIKRDFNKDFIFLLFYKLSLCCFCS